MEKTSYIILILVLSISSFLIFNSEYLKKVFNLGNIPYGNKLNNTFDKIIAEINSSFPRGLVTKIVEKRNNSKVKYLVIYVTTNEYTIDEEIPIVSAELERDIEIKDINIEIFESNIRKITIGRKQEVISKINHYINQLVANN